MDSRYRNRPSKFSVHYPLSVSQGKAKTLIDRAKDTLPPNERQGYTTSEEALGRAIEHLSQQTNSDTSDKATRVAIDWQSRTIGFGRADYEISMDMISTETNALEWIRHLCGKSWMDMDLMREFVETVAICPPLSRFRSSITRPN